MNGAVARWAWEQVPYREVPYAEDQLLGRELIEAGFAKVFHPDARVLHSHDYPPVAFFRRYFDEFRSLREVLGFRQPWGPRQTLRGRPRARGRRQALAQEQGVQRPRPRRAAARSRGAIMRPAWRARSSARGRTGCRAPLRRLLSLEGRDSFTPYEVPGGAARARRRRTLRPGLAVGVRAAELPAPHRSRSSRTPATRAAR